MNKFLLISCAITLSVAIFVACGSTSKAATKSMPKLPAATQVKHLDWSRNAVIYEVNLRQYTDEGNIKAFKDELPRLKELGVNILWFMPIHPISVDGRKGTLGSYYAVQDYKAVNPEYGTLSDFKELVKEAHKMGFKVILDWVPNHSGRDNKWVKDHPDWYVKDASGKMVGPYDWTDVYKFDYSNPQMRAAMLDALKFWIKVADIDGYRVDVASEVPTSFWNEVRPALDSIKPVFMLAESPAPDLLAKAFDMDYNWPMKDLMNEISYSAGQNSYAKNKGNKMPVKDALAIDSLLAKQSIEYPQDSYMMNMVTNHDLNSWEGTEFDRYGKAVSGLAVLTYTLPGMPLIYTGQETGLNHSFEFFEKDKAPNWAKNDFFAFYKKLNGLKHSLTALRAGNEGAQLVRYHTTTPNTYIFSRGDKNGTVYVFTNLSDQLVTLKYKGKAPNAKIKGINWFNDTQESLPAILQPWEYKVIVVK